MLDVHRPRSSILIPTIGLVLLAVGIVAAILALRQDDASDGSGVVTTTSTIPPSTDRANGTGSSVPPASEPAITAPPASPTTEAGAPVVTAPDLAPEAVADAWVLAVTSVRPGEPPEAQFNRARPYLTRAFAAASRNLTQPAPAGVEVRSTISGRTPPETIGDAVTLLVTVEQVEIRDGQPVQELDLTTWRVRLIREDGRWRVDDGAPV